MQLGIDKRVRLHRCRQRRRPGHLQSRPAKRLCRGAKDADRWPRVFRSRARHRRAPGPRKREKSPASIKKRKLPRKRPKKKRLKKRNPERKSRTKNPSRRNPPPPAAEVPCEPRQKIHSATAHGSSLRPFLARQSCRRKRRLQRPTPSSTQKYSPSRERPSKTAP